MPFCSLRLSFCPGFSSARSGRMVASPDNDDADADADDGFEKMPRLTPGIVCARTGVCVGTRRRSWSGAVCARRQRGIDTLRETMVWLPVLVPTREGWAYGLHR